MDYATANQRIAEKQKEYMAQGKDAATAIVLAFKDLPEEAKAYSLRGDHYASAKQYADAQEGLRAEVGRKLDEAVRAHMTATGEKDYAKAMAEVLAKSPAVKQVYSGFAE